LSPPTRRSCRWSIWTVRSGSALRPLQPSLRSARFCERPQHARRSGGLAPTGRGAAQHARAILRPPALRLS
jgi:hypothetical protein